MVVLIFIDLLIQDISNVIGFQMVQVMQNCYINQIKQTHRDRMWVF